MTTIEELEHRLKDLTLRNSILRDRPDLPVERIRVHDEVVKLQENYLLLLKFIKYIDLEPYVNAYEDTRCVYCDEFSGKHTSDCLTSQVQHLIKEVG